MASWLTPGRGWLVVEDPTYLKPALSGRQEWAALLENCETLLATTQGTDAGWAGRIPAAMAAAGLTDIRVSVRVATVGEGEWRTGTGVPASNRPRPALVAHGLMTDERGRAGGCHVWTIPRSGTWPGRWCRARPGGRDPWRREQTGRPRAAEGHRSTRWSPIGSVRTSSDGRSRLEGPSSRPHASLCVL